MAIGCSAQAMNTRPTWRPLAAMAGGILLGEALFSEQGTLPFLIKAFARTTTIGR